MVKLAEFAGKKMIGVFHHDEMIIARQRSNDCFDLANSTMLIVASVNEKLGLVAPLQEGKIGVVDWNAQANEVSDAGILAANLQTHPGSETEAGGQQQRAGKFRRKKVESGADIVLLAAATVVLADAEAGTAKIEAQNGNT